MNKTALFFILAIVDQGTKYLTVKGLLPDWGGLFVHSCNPNIAWGIVVPETLFWIGWIAAVLLLSWLFYANSYNFFVGLVLAGALLNMLDRFVYGCVVDFISVSLFPAFNLADSMITLGCVLFIFKLFSANDNKIKG